jgi:hypothetical protein
MLPQARQGGELLFQQHRSFTVNHKACWSDRMQVDGQMERGIPIGISKNQAR